MTSVPELPEVLLDEAPTVKLLYLWLAPQGEVSWSQREIAVAVGITQANVSRAMKRLGEVGFLVGTWGLRGRRRGRYGILLEDGSSTSGDNTR